MNIVIDTHALLWLVTNDKKLSSRAKTIIRDASQIFIPTIVLLELFYLLHKKDLIYTYSDLLIKLKSEIRYSIFSLDIATVEVIVQKPVELEMHDSIIVATAQMLGVSIVTKDMIISKVYKDSVW